MPSSRKTLELLARIRATEIETSDLPAALAGPLGEIKSELAALDDEALDAFLDDQLAKLRPPRPAERLRTVDEARALGRASITVQQRRQTLRARKPVAKKFTPKAFEPVEQPSWLEGGK